MAPTRQRKRASGQTPSPRSNQTTVPTKAGTPTRTPNRSLRTKPGLTVAQKQALIDNLQLEITERARRLRAQYNLQAQGLRSRIEIRVNRIPISLRRMTVGDLLARNQPRSAATTAAAAAAEDHGPPVPAKDTPQKNAHGSQYKPATYNGSSDELAGPDKENDRPDNPKKRTRAPNAPPQILSPASSNSRLPPARERPASASKSLIARPSSPAKPAPRTGVFSGMVEKAKSVRGGAARRAAAASAAGTAGAGTAAARKRANTGASAGPGAGAARATARAARRVSASSSVSTETASTVVRKGARAPAKKAAAAPAAKKAPAGGTTKRAGPAKAAATRVLRNRA